MDFNSGSQNNYSGDLADGRSRRRSSLSNTSAAPSIKESFSAWFDKGSGNKNLKTRRNELDALRARIKADKLTKADNIDILTRYDTIVGELQTTLSNSKTAKNQAETNRRNLEAELKPWEVKLDDMKDAHRRDLRPLQDEHDSAKRSLNDIEDELNAALKEYDSIERNLRRASDEKRSTLEIKLSAQKPLVQNWEVQKASAVNRKNQAEAAYEGKRNIFISEERPLEAEVERLKGLIASEKANIDAAVSTIDNAQKRLDYCRHVKDNEIETARLGEMIVKNEEYERDLTQQIEALAKANADLAKRAFKAKVLTIVAAVLLIAIIAIVVILVLKLT